MNLVFAFLVAIAAGVAVGACFRVFARRSLLGATSAGATIAGLMVFCSLWANPHTLNRAAWWATRPFRSTPERLVGDYATGLEADPELRIVLEESTRRTSTALAARGVARLDNATLRMRAEILNEVLPRLSDSVCAGIARGRLPVGGEAELTIALCRLDADLLARWIEISKKALLAELRQVPPAELSEEEVSSAIAAVREELSPDQLQRLMSVGEDSDDVDAAWAARTLYGRALALPHSQGSALLRILAASE